MCFETQIIVFLKTKKSCCSSNGSNYYQAISYLFNVVNRRRNRTTKFICESCKKCSLNSGAKVQHYFESTKEKEKNFSIYFFEGQNISQIISV